MNCAILKGRNLTIFGSYFGRNDAFINLFWNLQTFILILFRCIELRKVIWLMFWKIGSKVKKNLSEIKSPLLKKLRLRMTKSRNPRLIIQLYRKFPPARVGVNFNQEQINSKIGTKSCNICFHSVAPLHDDTIVRKKLWTFSHLSIDDSSVLQSCAMIG